MVYFPEIGTPATADPKTVAAAWTERIDSEYREMPGLRLTLAQALVETPEGLYCVGGDLHRARRGTA